MFNRFVISLGSALTIAAFAMAPVQAAGQAQAGSPKKPAAVGGAPAAKTAKTWVPPKTPWGDPDISGNLNNINESNTPFERPEEFAGKRIEDITPEQMAKLANERQKNTVENAPYITGSRTDGIAIGVPIHWLESLDSQNSRPWFVVDPPDGKVPPLTPEANERNAAAARARQGRSVADSFTDRSLGDRCISRRGTPAQAMTPSSYGNSYQILQTKDYVAIRYEMDGTRIIPLEGRGAARPHVGQGVRSYFGDAIGRWEGNTLVVDTTNFGLLQAYRGSREGLHLVERFTRTGPKSVDWRVTVDDSHTWARPWTFAIPLVEDDGQPIFEYACHEGNYGIRNILAGAREDQKKGIEPSNGPALPPGQEE